MGWWANVSYLAQFWCAAIIVRGCAHGFVRTNCGCGCVEVKIYIV